MHSTPTGPGSSRTSPRSWLLAAVAACSVVLVAACVPPDPGPPSSTSTTTTTVDPHAVTDVRLSWAYSQYAQYGVFGAWCQTASGPNVSIDTADGEDVTGLPAEAGTEYTLGVFDGGSGSIDPDTGEGTITWDTGDWVINAYCGNFGAPDETLSDPILQIGSDGSGTLSFEAFIPAGLDINGNPAPAAGPERIDIATFDSIDELGATGLSTTPDFEGRSYTPSSGSPWEPCEVDGVVTGGSWPEEWISFLPASVRPHYYTTGCGGLNLRKPPVAFDVDWGVAPT